LRRVLPPRYVANVTALGQRVSERRGRLVATWAVFLVAFALGRLVSYSAYVTGAHFARSSSLGPLFTSTIQSPWAIALQVLLVVVVGSLGVKNWTKRATP
jgi:membrane-associated PAP2 superfamily phosphatase